MIAFGGEEAKVAPKRRSSMANHARFILKTRTQPHSPASDPNPVFASAMRCNHVILGNQMSRPTLNKAEGRASALVSPSSSSNISVLPSLPKREPIHQRIVTKKPTSKSETPINIKVQRSLLQELLKDREKFENRNRLTDQDGNLIPVSNTWLGTTTSSLI